eukprot:ANDGO_04836.mRNA.1 fungal Zn(2)-Cys(6) binuclear cluster domain containing protein
MDMSSSKAACQLCRNAHKKCNGMQPCKRCLDLSIPDQCLYPAPKKRGRPKKNSGNGGSSEDESDNAEEQVNASDSRNGKSSSKRESVSHVHQNEPTAKRGRRQAASNAVQYISGLNSNVYSPSGSAIPGLSAYHQHQASQHAHPHVHSLHHSHMSALGSSLVNSALPVGVGSSLIQHSSVSPIIQFTLPVPMTASEFNTPSLVASGSAASSTSGSASFTSTSQGLSQAPSSLVVPSAQGGNGLVNPLLQPGGKGLMASPPSNIRIPKPSAAGMSMQNARKPSIGMSPPDHHTPGQPGSKKALPLSHMASSLSDANEDAPDDDSKSVHSEPMSRGTSEVDLQAMEHRDSGDAPAAHHHHTGLFPSSSTSAFGLTRVLSTPKFPNSGSNSNLVSLDMDSLYNVDNQDGAQQLKNCSSSGSIGFARKASQTNLLDASSDDLASMLK